MQLELVQVHNEKTSLAYAVARVVYAETLAKSLRLVEALTSMIFNATHGDKKLISEFISNKKIFESRNRESVRHEFLFVNADKREFQMCLRVALRMLHGNLGDMCNHATMFHRAEFLPTWATSRGYVADIDGILFYA